MSKLTVTIEKVGPAKAFKYLDLLNGNRPVRQSRLDFYIGILKNGLWRTTHQGIAFHIDGRLVDGQHRLWAIIETGIEVEIMVTRGLDDADVAALDKNSVRNYRDTAHYEGWEQDDPVGATIAKLIVIGVGNRSRAVPETVLNSWYAHYHEGIDFSLSLRTRCRGPGGKRFPAAMSTAFARAYYSCNSDLLERMGEIMKTGQRDVVADAAATVLRDAWIAGRLGVNWTDQYHKSEAAIRAFVSRRPIRQLQAAHDELFEVPKLPAALRYQPQSSTAKSDASARSRLMEKHAALAGARA